MFDRTKQIISATMSAAQRLVALKSLTTPDPTRGYRDRRHLRADTIIDDIPRFRLFYARLMERDTSVLLGIAIRNAVLSLADVEITGNRPDVARYVREQWDIIWGRHWHVIAETKKWGFLGVQLDFLVDADGHPEIECVKDFGSHDAQPLVHESRTVGTRIRAVDLKPHADLWNPRGAWFTFNARRGLFYGESIFRNAYDEWWEKWMDSGARRVRQQRMIKDAYRTDLFKVPEGESIETDNGDVITWMDNARQMQENALSGAGYVVPSDVHPDGSTPKFEVEFAKDAGDPVAIFKWVDDLDERILMALGILPEVVKAQASGSGFSGRSIPLMMTIQAVQLEFMEYAEQINRQILRPLAILAFGGDPDYKLKPTKLLEEFTEDIAPGMTAAQGGGLAGGLNAGQQPPSNGQAMSRNGAQQFADSTEPVVDDIIRRGTNAAMKDRASIVDTVNSQLKKKRMT